MNGVTPDAIHQGSHKSTDTLKIDVSGLLRRGSKHIVQQSTQTQTLRPASRNIPDGTLLRSTRHRLNSNFIYVHLNIMRTDLIIPLITTSPTIVCMTRIPF